MGEAKKKQIECPAMGRRVKPAECGENRSSNYDCPADCPQNPWGPANYDHALEINDRYVEKIMARLRAEQVQRFGYPQSPPRGANENEFTLLQWFSGKFFRERDTEGRTFKERWEAERYRGLNNDQRVQFAAESKMRAALIEIQQVLDHQSVVAVDLLDPERRAFTLFDRSLAAMACRFTTLFSVIYSMPHYVRIHSAATALPEVPCLSMREVLGEITEHLGAAKGDETSQEWLLENLKRITDSIHAVTSARHEAMLRGMDAVYTKSVYTMRCTPAKFRKVMDCEEDMVPEVVEGDDADAGFKSEWVLLAEDSPVGVGRSMIGRALLHHDGHIQLEASSQARSVQLKERVESLFGNMLEFSAERTDDLASQLAEKHALNYDSALVPESLMGAPRQVQTSTSQVPLDGDLTKEEMEEHFARSFMESFLESAVPSLDGLTPREAAADSATRPRLIELMKSHVRSHDEGNLRAGRESSINWLLEELGLDEINFPPPPRRAPTGRQEEEDAWEEDEEEDLFELTHEQLEERLKGLSELGDNHLLSCFSSAYPDIEGIIHDMTRELGLDSEEQGVMLLAAQSIFIYFEPLERPVPGLDESLVCEHLDDLAEELRVIDLSDLVKGLAQPLVALMLYSRLKEIMRFGMNDPKLSAVWVVLTAISEAADQVQFDAMAAALEHLRGER